MIYLLSQMILALAVAIVLGMALGWIIHRGAHNRTVQQLQHKLARQHAQVAQAQSDVSMLTDDYDELHRKTTDQIQALREDNQQIPVLTTNLEKSQLLVQQMMKRHEVKVRDLNNENQRLKARLASLETQKPSPESPTDRRNVQTKPDVGNESPMSTPQQQAHEDTLEQTSGSHAEFLASKPPLYAAAESEDDPFDEVMEVADELQRELDDTETDAMADDKARFERADPALAATSSALLNSTASSSTQTSLEPLEVSDPAAADDANSPDDSDDNLEFDTFEFSDDQTFEPLDDPELDGSTDSSTLFDPVSQQDDLQQIFGIGPLTEKALNELGITSYSQLAELKQHDIQKIANALEIGVSRIERDNWVGNARRQLEEVLEQL